MKKVAFVTHSYHQKTRSTNILAEEIFNENEYAVDYHYIDDWTPNSVGSNKIIEGYDIVVLVQLISSKILQQIKCENIVFIPMYDFSHSWDIIKWLECSNLKILSLTKSLHDKLSKVGLNSYHIKYYPEPAVFTPGDLSQIFFWQRITDINLKTTIKLLHNFNINKIYLHKAIDPHHTFVHPSQDEITKYNIEISDWFENKNEYLNILKKTGIYIAPRLFEGGAAAFIDAMKMGKIVIANDSPAMNEYITHEKNGFLYNANNIDHINFSSLDLAQIQKNAHHSIINGRIKWRESIPNIVDFIETKNTVLISDIIIDSLQEYRESLRLEKAALMRRAEQAEEKLKFDAWYNFGKLSFKRKIIKMLTLMWNRLLKRHLWNVQTSQITKGQ